MTKRVPSQKAQSMWMVLAMLQSLFWLFGIPYLCRAYIWDNIFGTVIASHPEHGVKISKFLMSCFVPQAFYTCYTLVMIPIYAGRYPFFEQYKIHIPNQNHTCWPWFHPRQAVRHEFQKLLYRSLKFTFFNLFLLGPFLGLVQLFVMRKVSFLKINPNMFSTNDEHWPSFSKNIRDIVALAVLHEFGFYVTHRLMHAYPFLYKYHKVHHEFKTNVTLAALHNHPVDFVLSIGGPYLLANVLVPGAHSISQFQWSLWALYANLDDHVGYAFPWSPVRWFPLSASTEEHEFHHSRNKGCYGSKLSIFGLVLGDYEEYDRCWNNNNNNNNNKNRNKQP